jgi:hypothetical protein
VAECLVFAVRVPVIVCLVVSMVLLERIVQVTVQPEELGDHTEIECHLGVLIRLIVVASADWVDLLVKV